VGNLNPEIQADNLEPTSEENGLRYTSAWQSHGKSNKNSRTAAKEITIVLAGPPPQAEHDERRASRPGRILENQSGRGPFDGRGWSEDRVHANRRRVEDGILSRASRRRAEREAVRVENRPGDAERPSRARPNLTARWPKVRTLTCSRHSPRKSFHQKAVFQHRRPILCTLLCQTGSVSSRAPTNSAGVDSQSYWFQHK